MWLLKGLSATASIWAQLHTNTASQIAIPAYWNRGARLMKKEYSGNLVANGLLQQIQDADQRQCCNSYICDRTAMLTVWEPVVNEETVVFKK